jgi:hypothetical protein
MGDELGTLTVYRRLVASAVDVHVYGVDDAPPPDGLDVRVHAGDHLGYREFWCVSFVPDAADLSVPHAALVALETGHNE